MDRFTKFDRASARGRRRSLDRTKKNLLCEAVARGATMSEAAVTVGVSLRTVQREARINPDFDRQLRLAHNDTPDPIAIMHTAARTHWRAAAWLLERTNPEDYGRRPATSCSPFQFEQALQVVIDAALRLAPPDNRANVFGKLTAAAETAFKAVFPNYGPCGRRLVARLPATPLADAEQLEVLRNPNRIVPDRIEPAPQLQPRALPGDQQVGWVDRAAATHHHETNQHRCLPAPRQTHPTEGVELAANGAPHSQTIQHPESSVKHPAPQARKSLLSWRYILRAAGANPIAPTSASILDPPILSHLSPKTRSATQFKHDNNPPASPPHSVPSPHPVE